MTTSLSDLTDRLVTRLATVGQSRPTRRSVLAAATLTGTALAVDPWGYITKPQGAYASVCGPGATCDAGWSAMCCSINQGRNTCPPNTYAGGWWKADRSSFCGGAARYYIDCNATPGHHFTCRCNKSNCDHRYVACNVFRYGQCNTQVKGVTAVVCRQISCTPPWKLYPGTCGTSSATDNNTRAHNAPCLTAKNTYPRTVTYPAAPTALAAGHTLKHGQTLVAPDRHTQLSVRADGNVVLTNWRGVTWQTHTDGHPGAYLYMGRGGRLYVKSAGGTTLWRTSTPIGTTRVYAAMSTSGRLVVVRGGRSVWSTNTHTP